MMNGNVVSNIVIADNKEDTEKALNCTLIEYNDNDSVDVGWCYNYETGTFVPPQIEEEVEVL